MLIALLIPLALAIAVYAIVLMRAVVARKIVPSGEGIILGAVTNFFDTLGIGSFAPTMAWIKFRKLVPDRLIPCTMLVGHTPPAMTQGFIFLILLGVKVDPVLLVGCVIGLLMGGLLGVRLVVRTRVWIVQLVVAFGLFLAALMYALTNLHLMPGGGTAETLPVSMMAIAIIANFMFGILFNYGVGNYAPTLAMFSLMGMDPRLCFPIMAAGAGLAGAAASIGHIKIGEIDFRLATGITLGGIPLVFVAAFIVKSMSVEMLRWLVFVVVLYAGAVMLRAALQGRKGEQEPLVPEALAG